MTASYNSYLLHQDPSDAASISVGGQSSDSAAVLAGYRAYLSPARLQPTGEVLDALADLSTFVQYARDARSVNVRPAPDRSGESLSHWEVYFHSGALRWFQHFEGSWLMENIGTALTEWFSKSEQTAAQAAVGRR